MGEAVAMSAGELCDYNMYIKSASYNTRALRVLYESTPTFGWLNSIQYQWLYFVQYMYTFIYCIYGIFVLYI